MTAVSGTPTGLAMVLGVWAVIALLAFIGKAIISSLYPEDIENKKNKD